MDFKSEAVKKLRYYNLKKLSLQTTQIEYQRLGEQMAAIRSSLARDCVSGGEGGGHEDVMLALIEKRSALDAAMKNTKAWIRVVDKAMESLDEEDRLILTTLYVNRTKGGVDYLCETLYVEKATVYRRRKRALQEFTIAMYGTET